MKLQIKNIIKETEDALSLSFKNGNFFNKVSYKPGQFLTIHVPIDGVVHKRAYSFSSNPYTDKDLKITIKKVDKGLVSNYIHGHVKIGDKLETDKPAGSFYIEPDKNAKKQYVFFAGGSGITPIYSIVESVLTNEPNSKILLVYANQTLSSVIFQKEIKALESKFPDNFSVEHIITYIKKNEANYHSGLATKELIDTIFSMNEEHGYLDTTRSSRAFHVGEVMRVIPNHVCTCVNLHDEVFLLRDGRVQGTWRVAARGKIRWQVWNALPGEATN